jgi:hypothetical protein
LPQRGSMNFESRAQSSLSFYSESRFLCQPFGRV